MATVCVLAQSSQTQTQTQADVDGSHHEARLLTQFDRNFDSRAAIESSKLDEPSKELQLARSMFGKDMAPETVTRLVDSYITCQYRACHAIHSPICQSLILP